MKPQNNEITYNAVFGFEEEGMRTLTEILTFADISLQLLLPPERLAPPGKNVQTCLYPGYSLVH